MVLEDLKEESIRGLLLSFTGDYYPSKIQIIMKDVDIATIQETDIFKDVFYGRKIQGKFYFARHEYLNKEKPYIDYYNEFFSIGEELNFG